MNGNMRHLCIDMQRQFAEDTPWQVPWMEKVSPQIGKVVSRHAEQTVFTRFMSPQTPPEAPGMWRPYYEKWCMMTRQHLPAEMFDIVPDLARYSPPALVLDKTTYSPRVNGRLHEMLQRTEWRP